jgi:hypothetical protein
MIKFDFVVIMNKYLDENFEVLAPQQKSSEHAPALRHEEQLRDLRGFLASCLLLLETKS